MDALKTGQYIKEQRQKLNLSQKSLAEMLYVEPQTISKWERGLGMPDYDNLGRLKEIFNCSLSDILEPNIDVDDGEYYVVGVEEESTDLPVLIETIKNADNGGEETQNFNAFDFGNKKKMNQVISKVFGVEYEEVFNDKFLFKGALKKRTKADYETTLMQGMEHTVKSNNVLGLKAPWMYLRVFAFMLLFSIIGTVATIFSTNPIYCVISLGSFITIPLLVFLFESNFSRDISIIKVIKAFFIGGITSILFALILFLMAEEVDEVVLTVVFAPIFEEIAKAVITLMFLSKMKPKNMLSGLLIGFAVGAGFTVFENFAYGVNGYLLGIVEYGTLEDGVVDAILTMIVRSVSDIANGHHYWAGFFGAIYVMFKQKSKFSLKDLFQWKVMLTLFICMCLHAAWNGHTFIVEYDLFGYYIVKALIYIITTTIFFKLINIGIAQTKVMNIYEFSKFEKE